MPLKTIVLMIAAVQLAAPLTSRPPVTIKGTATDCFADSIIRIPTVRVSAFDAAASGEMLDSLRAMESLSFDDNPSAAITRMNVQFERVITLSRAATPLATVKTDGDGAFEISTAPVDSVLLLATYDDEGELFPYAYGVVSGRSNHSINLDLSRGGCDYIKEPGF